MLARLPASIISDILLLSPTPGEVTRSLGRLARLARALAGPARAASLHTIAPCAELARQLASDPTLTRHFRWLVLRAPEELEAPVYGGPVAALQQRHRRVAEWKQHVARVLFEVGPIAQLTFVLSDHTLDLMLVAAIRGYAWPGVIVDASQKGELDPAEQAIVLALFRAVAGAVRSLDIYSLDLDGGEGALMGLEWPHLREVRFRRVEPDLASGLIRRAPAVVAIDTDALSAVRAADGALWDRITLRITGGAAEPDAEEIALMRATEGVESFECSFQSRFVPALLLASPPSGLHKLRVRVLREDDMLSASGVLLIALSPSMWPNSRIPEAIELVYGVHDGQTAPFANGSLARIMPKLMPLKHACASRGVNFEVVLDRLRIAWCAWTCH